MRMTKKALPASSSDMFIRVDLLPVEAEMLAEVLQQGVDELTDFGPERTLARSFITWLEELNS